MGLGVTFVFVFLGAAALAFLVFKKERARREGRNGMGKTAAAAAGFEKDDPEAAPSSASASVKRSFEPDFFPIKDIPSAPGVPQKLEPDMSFALRSELDKVHRLENQIANLEKENTHLTDATRVMRQEAQILAGLMG